MTRCSPVNKHSSWQSQPRISGGLDLARHAGTRNVAYCPHWLAGGVGLVASTHALAASGSANGYAEVDANHNPLR